MTPGDALFRRQIWAVPTATSSSEHRHCTPFTLPSNGILTIDLTSTITLTQNAIFHPQCTGDASIKSNVSGSNSSVVDFRDPFYASVSPQIYAIAAATVVSYMLVIMLFITPRTFFVGGAGGGGGFLGRRGIIRGAFGSGSVVGVGGRPWLQKVATLTVAISLTIASFNTFKVAQKQYEQGYEDAVALTDEVVGSLEIRVIRVISDTFLWLAQVQTLIRLFPRHKEKVIIKWIGFALIVLDTIFSILNSFVHDSSRMRPRSFTDAIPALCYLFELALSLLYAAWVIYYSLEKRRFAFFHSKMRNIFLVALLSLTAILIPVIFFVLDISKPDVAGWGDYMRWVGAAAASVVVWEWVERIEALERDERKGGILGREIFDGDEMLGITPSSEINWPGNRRDQSRTGGTVGGGDRDRVIANSSGWSGARKMESRAFRSRALQSHIQSVRNEEKKFASSNQNTTTSQAIGSRHISFQEDPVPPLPTASPISRADTTSAASTLYAVHYHSVSASTTPGPDLSAATPVQNEDFVDNHPSSSENTQPLSPNQGPTSMTGPGQTDRPANRVKTKPERRWRFKRHCTSPPREVSHAVQHLPNDDMVAPTHSLAPHLSGAGPDHATGWLRSKRKPKVPEVPLPRVVIPAPVRGSGSVWSPAVPDEETVESPRPIHEVPELQPTISRDTHTTELRRPESGEVPVSGPASSLDSSQQRKGKSPKSPSNGKAISQPSNLTIQAEEGSSLLSSSHGRRASAVGRILGPPNLGSPFQLLPEVTEEPGPRSNIAGPSNTDGTSVQGQLLDKDMPSQNGTGLRSQP